MSRQNDIEHLQDLMQRGVLSAEQANVALVKIERFRLILNSIPRNVRKALNEAVKSGELGHMKKDGHKPECFYHPTFDYMAKGARRNHEESVKNTLLKVAGWQAVRTEEETE